MTERDDNLIRLPLPDGRGVWNATEQRMVVRCEDNVHVYIKVPGRCQCSEHYWDGQIPEDQIIKP